jgi:uncharacterized protein DUF3175
MDGLSAESVRERGKRALRQKPVPAKNDGGARRTSKERKLRAPPSMTATTKRRRHASSHEKGSKRRWSARVTRDSNALDLDRSVFTWKDPKKIARSLKRSAEHSHRRKSAPYRSAMSMLTFYINRAGKNLGTRQRHVLEQAKEELRHAFARD